jgi:hypothetical protein
MICFHLQILLDGSIIIVALMRESFQGIDLDFLVFDIIANTQAKRSISSGNKSSQS